MHHPNKPCPSGFPSTALSLAATLMLLALSTVAACPSDSVGATPREFGEGCCTQPTFPNGQPCDLGACAEGLECYVVPMGPNSTRGVCTTSCAQDPCDSPEATCFFDRCLLLCDPGPNPPADQCPDDLACRLVQSEGFCIP